MKKRLIKSLAFSLSAALIIGICITFAKRNIEKSPEVTDIGETNITYLVKAYENNKIGIFEENASSPSRTVESFLSVLPDSDVAKLIKGIYVRSTDELRGLIEDITS